MGLFRVSTYQMILLLLFNKTPIWSWEEILQETKIPMIDAENHLLSLCHPKILILCKSPPTPRIENSHRFKLNTSYINTRTDSCYRPVSILASYRNDLKPKVWKFWLSNQLERLIINIIKNTTKITHQNLVKDIYQRTKQLKIPPNYNYNQQIKFTLTDINKMIQRLIQLEYIQRNNQDYFLYEYIY